MPAEDPRRPCGRGEAARRRELRRRQIRRRRAAALTVVAAVVVLGVLALSASGGEQLTGSGRAAERKPLVPAAVADLRVRRLSRLGKPVYCGGRHRPYVALTF